MSRRARIALKAATWAACLAPLAALLWWTTSGDLTANPISFITNHLGDWTFRILLASLAMTPLRIVSGWSWPVTLRRLLGLFAFFYATLHFSVWVLIDHFFNWSQMLSDIVKRPYITVGMLTLTLLIPLAATSTASMVKRLGAANWKRLHRLVYVAGITASLHFLWLAKVGRTDQYVHVAVMALLLGIRAWDAIRRAFRRRRARLEAAVGAAPSIPSRSQGDRGERSGAPPDDRPSAEESRAPAEPALETPKGS